MPDQASKTNAPPVLSAALWSCGQPGGRSLSPEAQKARAVHGDKKMATGLPYFKFYVMEYLAGEIQAFDMETQGVFVNILARIWKEGGRLERNDAKLALLLRMDKDKLSNCLNVLSGASVLLVGADGCLTTSFIQEQLSEREHLHEKRANAGRKGGNARALKALAKQKQATSRERGRAESEVESEVKKEKKEKSSSRFVPPTAEDIQAYCTKKGFAAFDAEYFVMSYGAKDWMIGKSKMKDWRLTVCRAEKEGWCNPKNIGRSSAAGNTDHEKLV